MEDAMDLDATPSATSSSTSSSSQRKRKHGMVACSRAASMAVLKKRAAKMTKQQHKDKTVSGNHGKAKTLITWLVKETETRALTTSTDSEYKTKVGTRHYWFNWGKLPLLATGLTCFCESWVLCESVSLNSVNLNGRNNKNIPNLHLIFTFTPNRGS